MGFAIVLHWEHQHRFARAAGAGERNTRIVIGLTAAMMVIEIAAGYVFGSMALLTDGWHMGTHVTALSITVLTYVYARRHQDDPRYSFGTGKVGVLGGFASAVALAAVALMMGLDRMKAPMVARGVQLRLGPTGEAEARREIEDLGRVLGERRG